MWIVWIIFPAIKQGLACVDLEGSLNWCQPEAQLQAVVGH